MTFTNARNYLAVQKQTFFLEYVTANLFKKVSISYNPLIVYTPLRERQAV
jgi:hypothetical protein